MTNRNASLTGLLAAGALAVWGLAADRPAVGQSADPNAANPAPTARPVAPAAGLRLPLGPSTLSADPFGGLTPPMMAQPDGSPETDEMRQLQHDAVRLEQELNGLVQEYTAASDDTKADLRSRIQQALQQQFEARQKTRDLEIADLEAQVKRLRELHARRESAKTEIIESRLAQLLRSAEGLGWDGSGTDVYSTKATRPSMSLLRNSYGFPPAVQSTSEQPPRAR